MAERIIQKGAMLPNYASSADRIANVEHDIRDTMAKLRAELRLLSERHTVAGWVADEDEQYASVREGTERMIIAQLRMTR